MGCIVLSGSFLLLEPAMIGSFSASCMRCNEETARHWLFVGVVCPLFFFCILLCWGALPLNRWLRRPSDCQTRGHSSFMLCNWSMEVCWWTVRDAGYYGRRPR